MIRHPALWLLATTALVVGCLKTDVPGLPADADPGSVIVGRPTASLRPMVTPAAPAAPPQGPPSPGPSVQAPIVPTASPGAVTIVTGGPQPGGGGGAGAAPTSVPTPVVTDPLVLTHTHVVPTAIPTTSLPPTAEPPAPQGFATGTRLAFVAATTGNPEIYLANTDGTGRMQLTFDARNDLYPRLSADRREIVWSSDRGAAIFALYRMWTDGSHPVRVTFGSRPATQPAFSPDGLKIAFVRWTGAATSAISVINRDGTNEVRVSPDGGQAFGPGWSPDGAQLVFASNHADGVTPVLYRMPAGGGTLSAISHGGTDFPTGGADWSPNGTRIAYATNVANHGLGITLIDPTGANRLELTHNNDTDPAWSHDGSKLLFTTLASGTSQLASVNADGSGLAVLTSGPAYAAQGSW